jgi:hypothetical protein
MVFGQPRSSNTHRGAERLYRGRYSTEWLFPTGSERERQPQLDDEAVPPYARHRKDVCFIA